MLKAEDIVYLHIYIHTANHINFDQQVLGGFKQRG